MKQPQEEKVETALITVDKPLEALSLSRSPDVVLEEATRAAKALTDVIERKKRKVVFNGETYLEFEDWQTLGRFYGVTSRVRETHQVKVGDDPECQIRGFEATADAILVSSGQVISSADAMCLNDEYNWQRKPMFQLRSMAQTRACAKALRNVLAWVVVLAGYKPTPAEEMPVESPDQHHGIQRAQRKSQPQPERVITEAQRKHIFAVAREHNVTHEQLKAFMVEVYGIDSTKEIPSVVYPKILEWLANDGGRGTQHVLADDLEITEKDVEFLAAPEPTRAPSEKTQPPNADELF